MRRSEKLIKTNLIYIWLYTSIFYLLYEMLHFCMKPFAIHFFYRNGHFCSRSFVHEMLHFWMKFAIRFYNRIGHFCSRKVRLLQCYIILKKVCWFSTIFVFSNRFWFFLPDFNFMRWSEKKILILFTFVFMTWLEMFFF